MSDNIKVVVKVRPLISRELEDKQNHQWRVQNNTLYQLDSNSRDVGQAFTFDKVYNDDTKTPDVYNDVAKPIVEAATAGFNGTIFAYGQTSSGKTYTMTGTETSPGIIPLSVLNLFEIIKNIPDRDFLVRVSYIEIYNETVKDLLDPKKENIKIHETYEGCIKVDVTEKVTSSPEEVLEAMRVGEANRQTGSTNMNEKSSRSHSIFQITIESREHIEGTAEAGCVKVSQLNLVDLAGSERSGQTGATGIRFKEGTHINKSLSALALLIKQLSEDPNKYANYRDSKLTRILKNSLGGNAKTSIICAITPAALEETISTLQFATRAKAIKNKPSVNEVATDATMIQSLTKKLSKLQSQLESKKNLEVMLKNKQNVEQDLQNKIANLQKLILNGFGQRSSIEQIVGARRKQPPRRITISTLSLHAIDEDVPAVPKFCTPTLKYNPMLVPKPADFVPIQSFEKLPSLPEEPSRLVTPPPDEKKVNFIDGIIEIDSDDDADGDNDDDTSTVPTCSPYHKCYSVSKTPPCVLRKNFHIAEKNYREIVEFTEREKMYEPDVVELIEKLELSTNMTAKLQEDIEIIKKNSKDKDLEMEQLLLKISKAEEDLKHSKMELAAHTKEYNTKLTDCEVSYEILKTKAKLREEELLSLLEDQKLKKCKDIGKLPPKPVEKNQISFMDMSKDISLVNSDSESSITTSNEEEESRNMKLFVTKLQDQLIAKCQTIVQLEANIASQKQSIEFLEQSSHELQNLIDSFKEKNTYLENENRLYKSNVDALNDTIKDLKENLEIAQNYIVSYNHVIQELQIKLTKKDNLQHMNIGDSVLENMIANEEKVLANNENMKNIIHSFKIALDNRNKEIEQLKLSIKEISPNNALNSDIHDKIKVLNEENAKLKDESNSNIITINALMCEKSNFAGVEKELVKKMVELEKQKIELHELNNENILRIDNLNETNQNLLQTLSEKNAKELEYLLVNSEQQSKLDEMTLKITQIEKEINAKNDIISALSKVNNDHQEYENHAKSALHKLKSVMSILSGNDQEIPEFIENCVTLFNALSKGLCLLENVATDTVSKKSVVANENSQLKANILYLHNTFDIEKTTLQDEIDQLKQKIEDYLKEIVNLKDTNKKLSEEMISKYQREINAKNYDHDTLLAQCNIFKEDISKLNFELLQKQDIISSLNENDAKFKIKIDELKALLEHSNAALITEQDQLKSKVEIILKTLETVEELKSELNEKRKHVVTLQEKSLNLAQVQEQQFEKIFAKLCDISSGLNIENSFSREENNLCDNVLLLLDQMKNKVVTNENNIKLELVECKKSIATVLNENQNLTNKLTKLENENETLCNKLQSNNLDMGSLSKNLIESNELLEQLKEDLEQKAFQIQIMDRKAQACKDQFIDIDILMNQQLQDLRYENEVLKGHYKNEKQMQSESFSQKLYDFTPNKSTRAASQDNLINVKTITPPSLLTICCNKIVDTMEPKQNDYNLPSPSSSDTEILKIAKCASCDRVLLEMKILEQEKFSLLGILEQSEQANKKLLLEQENIRHEIQLLLEPTQELQKKISSHKTNMSILTATTYAENRSLKSQVLALQHHHRKLLNVCQGDIPEFKNQLHDLFVILKGEQLISENQNANIKRYSLPDVLDNNNTVCNFKNESALDGDLLMLDTNVTLTTTGDNTLVGYEQTCLDLTRTMFNEVSCQTNDFEKSEANHIQSHISLLESDSQNMFSSLELLKDENCKLRALVDKLSIVRVTEPKTLNSLMITDDETVYQIENKTSVHTDMEEEVKCLTQKLEDIQIEKQNLEKKYNDFVLEMPKTDALVSKFISLEKEHNLKACEISKLTNTLNIKNKELKLLQEENNALSTQVMENISEADDLNKQLDKIKSENLQIIEKVRKLQSAQQSNAIECTRCRSSIVATTHSVIYKDSPQAKLNRSLSDSDTSSRFNKICTLQSELCAGREDCKDLTEHVATIKQHLNCSNMSIDLDESMGDTNISQPKTPNSQHTICSMPDIREEQSLDIYTADKIDCYNYYLEITGEEREYVLDSVKIIDILKMCYNKLLEKHNNEVVNLLKKLQDYQELQLLPKTHPDDVDSKYSAISKTLEEKEENLSRLSKFMSQLKCNINRINNELNNKDNEAFAKVVNMFKRNFLSDLDYQFGISSVSVFEVIIGKCQEEIDRIKEQCAIQEQNQLTLDIEVGIVEQLKGKLAEKESQYNLLKAQNDKMFSINSAVTLDIVRKEELIHKYLNEGWQKLLQNKLISPDLVLSESAITNIGKMIDLIINQSNANNQQHQTKIETLTLEVITSKNIIDEKEKELDELKSQMQSLRDINNNVAIDLAAKEVKIQVLKGEHENLSKAYDSKIQENINKLNEIDKLSKEISSLRETINNKQSLISSLSEKKAETVKLLELVNELQKDNARLAEEITSLQEVLVNKQSLILSLSEKNAKTTELVISIRELQEDNNKLKSVNQIISTERESYSIDLRKSNETIQQNIADIEKMTTDILVLRESVKDATFAIESLKEEVQRLTAVNAELNLHLEEKRRECMRLEMNIKTHDKTAELQSKMIMRLKKQKEEDDRVIIENKSKINDVNEKFSTLQDECEKLKNVKESLEARVTELQEAVERPRTSLDPGAGGGAPDTSRRRRQSIHDSKRLLEHVDEHRNLEAVFESRQKTDDLFSECDDTSGRSTPFGLGKGHDSLLSRTEHSDKDEEHSSRPSSVQAVRRRRQSIHDMHRGVARHTPSPHDFSSQVNDELQPRDCSGKTSDSCEVIRLRAQLAACQQELEELKERYSELDDECETCAAYLRERDEQCARLKKEKTALEKQMMELKSGSLNSSERPSVAHVAVNTDEDWANLHAVVVDRMSYDAEVDKNKRLNKTIEELRFQKQDLKNTLAKMQNAIEKQHASKHNRELDVTKKELTSVKGELEELKVKYKELDEECETCAQYLKEREEQCRRLKESKAALENKLQEVQEDSHVLAHYSVRKKRQTVHDKNRTSALDQTDASTETNEDLLSHQVERDNTLQKETDDKLREIKRLKMIVDKLTHQKAALEQQLQSAQPMYVATGSAIVQNQQLTDVMKENQRLKKMNAKLVNMCKKRGKSDANRENEDPCEQG